MTVWHNFQANACSNKSSAKGAKGCCGGSSQGFCKKFNLAVVCGSETQMKRK